MKTLYIRIPENLLQICIIEEHRDLELDLETSEYNLTRLFDGKLEDYLSSSPEDMYKIFPFIDVNPNDNTYEFSLKDDDVKTLVKYAIQLGVSEERLLLNCLYHGIVARWFIMPKYIHNRVDPVGLQEYQSLLSRKLFKDGPRASISVELGNDETLSFSFSGESTE